MTGHWVVTLAGLAGIVIIELLIWRETRAQKRRHADLSRRPW